MTSPADAAFIQSAGVHQHRMGIHQKHATAFDTLEALVHAPATAMERLPVTNPSSTVPIGGSLDLTGLFYELDDIEDFDPLF